jgi:hypothetical protein
MALLSRHDQILNTLKLLELDLLVVLHHINQVVIRHKRQGNTRISMPSRTTCAMDVVDVGDAGFVSGLGVVYDESDCADIDPTADDIGG